jgi:hypothetical protein
MSLPIAKRRPWRAISILGIAILITLVGAAVWVTAVKARNQTKVDQRVDELRAGWGRCQARSRLPLEPSRLGDAWPHYRKALTLVQMNPKDRSILSTFIWNKAPSDRDEVHAALTKHLQALQALSIGARSSDLGTLRLLETEVIQERDSLTSLSLLCVVRSRLLADHGESRKACEPLLDLARLWMDYEERSSRESSSLIWSNYLTASFSDLAALASRAILTPEELEDLERQLVILDVSFPCYMIRPAQLLASIGEIISGPEDTLRDTFGEEGFQHIWRFAFSRVLLRQDYFFQHDSELRQVAPLHEGSYAELSDACRAFREECDHSANPLVRRAQNTLELININARRWHAEVRLARVAAHYRATSEVLEPQDPFGAKIFHELRDGKLILWCGGPTRGSHLPSLEVSR